MPRRIALLLGCLLVIASCTGGTAGDGSLASAIADGLRADPDRGELTFTRDEAACVADRVVARLGEDRLRDLGADRSPLDELAFAPDEQRGVFGAVDGCVDLVAQVAAFLAADGGVPEPVAACMAERYAASDELREALFGLETDPELAARIDAVLASAHLACTSPPA